MDEVERWMLAQQQRQQGGGDGLSWRDRLRMQSEQARMRAQEQQTQQQQYQDQQAYQDAYWKWMESQQTRSDKLSADAQKKLDEANQKNESRYLDILEGRTGTRDRVLGDLQNFGQSQINDANDRYGKMRSQMDADVYARGFGGSPSMLAANKRSSENARDRELNRINDDVISRRVNADAGLSDSLYGFMERRNDVPPDLSQLIALQQGLGRSGPMLGMPGGFPGAPGFPGNTARIPGGNYGDGNYGGAPPSNDYLSGQRGTPYGPGGGGGYRKMGAGVAMGGQSSLPGSRGVLAPPTQYGRSAGDAPTLPMEQFVRAWQRTSSPTQDYRAYENAGQQVPTIPGMMSGPIGGGGYTGMQVPYGVNSGGGGGYGSYGNSYGGGSQTQPRRSPYRNMNWNGNGGNGPYRTRGNRWTGPGAGPLLPASTFGQIGVPFV